MSSNSAHASYNDVHRTSPPSGGLAELLLSLSRRRGNANSQSVFDMHSASRRIARFFDADRCLLYHVPADEVSHHNAGSVDGSAGPWRVARAMRIFPWTWRHVVHEGKTLCLNSLDELPADAAVDRSSYEGRHIKSALVVPVPEAIRPEYVIGITAKHGRVWTHEQRASLQLIGEKLSHELLHIRAETVQRDADEFGRLLMRFSARFAGIRWHQVDTEIDRALIELGAMYQIDRVIIFEVRETKQTYLRHVVGGADTRTAAMPADYAESFPWAYHKVVARGEVFALPRLDELPPEAARHKAVLRERGVQSLLNIPLTINGKVRFVLAAMCPNPRTWTRSCITRLEAVGEILAGALSTAKAQSALAANEHDLHETLEIAHLGRWEWDIAADKMYVSKEAVRILGVEPANLAGLMNLVHPSGRGELERQISKARANPEQRLNVRYTLSGTRRVHTVVQQWHEVVFGDQGRLRLIATIQDVTTFSKIEQEVTELRMHGWHSGRVAQTGLLVATLAHELSQPLASILSNAQAGLRFMNNGRFDEEELRGILNDIVAANNNMTEVLGSLRAMMRRQRTTPVKFDVADAVHAVLTLVRGELIAEQIEIATSLEPGCCGIL